VDPGVVEHRGVVDPTNQRPRCLRELGGPLGDGRVGGVVGHGQHPSTGGVVVGPGQRGRVELDGNHGSVVEEPLD
jgi:hypothetical protein